MPHNIIQVGAKDHYRNHTRNVFGWMQEQDLSFEITTIDVEDMEPSPEHRHVVREEGQLLSDAVDSIGHEKPFVILAHANDLHTPEAIELMQNSESNPRIMIEKPYAINYDQLTSLGDLIKEHPDDVYLLEYYLQAKGVPLLVFGGVINKNGLFFKDNGILRVLEEDNQLTDYSGKIHDFIGDPLFVVSDVLEGEGHYGTVSHRGDSLIDKTKGGGMIQDLGHHALAPIMGLSNYLGEITRDSLKDVRTAFCHEYFQEAKERDIDEENIGESYAEMEFETSTGIPVFVHLGKYIQKNTNQRRIHIVGTKGMIEYDITNNVLHFRSGDGEIHHAIHSERQEIPKYLGVILSGIEYLESRNPFGFDPNSVAYGAQDIVLTALEMTPSKVTKYKQGTMHDEIF